MKHIDTSKLAVDPEKLQLLPYDHPMLRQPSKPCIDIETEVIPYIDAMKEIMRAYGGIGLSAVQVGLPYRYFLMVDTANKVRLVVDPVVIRGYQSKLTNPEGCLSKPGHVEMVERWHAVTVAWRSSWGDPCKIDLFGRDARVFQHETDHCNGIVIF